MPAVKSSVGHAPIQSRGKMGSSEDSDRKKRPHVANFAVSPPSAKKLHAAASLEEKKVKIPGISVTADLPLTFCTVLHL